MHAEMKMKYEMGFLWTANVFDATESSKKYNTLESKARIKGNLLLYLKSKPITNRQRFSIPFIDWFFDQLTIEIAVVKCDFCLSLRGILYDTSLQDQHHNTLFLTVEFKKNSLNRRNFLIEEKQWFKSTIQIKPRWKNKNR